MCVVRPLTMSWTVSRVWVDSRVTPPPPTLYARGGQVTGRPFGVICDPLLLSGPDPERTDQSVNAGVVWTRRGLCVWIWVWVKWSVSVRVSLCMLTNDSDIWHWKEHIGQMIGRHASFWDALTGSHFHKKLSFLKCFVLITVRKWLLSPDVRQKAHFATRDYVDLFNQESYS